MRCASAILSSVVCPALQHFSTFSHKRHDFRKTVVEHKMRVSCFSTNFVWNIVHYKKKRARYDRKCTSVFMWSTRYSCSILMKLEFSRQIFEKPSNIKLHKTPSSGSRVYPCGRTDMTKLIVAFRKLSNAPKNHCATSPNSLCLSAPRKGFYKSFRVLSAQLLRASFIVLLAYGMYHTLWIRAGYNTL